MCGRGAIIESLNAAVTCLPKERVSAYSRVLYCKLRLSPVESENEGTTVIQ